MNTLKSYKLFLESLVLEDYKYSEKQELMVRNWLTKKGVDPSEHNSFVIRFFKSYPKLIKKDINQYRTLADVNAALELAESFETDQEKKKKLKKDAEKADFGDYTFVLTFTPESSQFYGGNTTWCTAAKSTVYNWFMHRIIGVEFYLISKTDESKKYSLHLNWDKSYCTIYNAENSCNFDGENHEYNDIEQLRNFLKDDRKYDWMMEQFEMTKQDAPKIVPKFMEQLSNPDVNLRSFFDKFSYFTLLSNRIVDDYDDVLNETELDELIEYVSGLFDEFLVWFAKQDYNYILSILDDIEKYKEENNQKVDVDDHIFINESFRQYVVNVNPDFNKEYNSLLIFDSSDDEWLEEISENIGISVKTLTKEELKISDFYDNYDYSKLKGMNHIDMHIQILEDYFKK